MKRLTLILLMLSSSFLLKAQVGINTTSPDTTALMDIHFDGKTAVGVLLPNLNDALRKTKKNVSDGMVVFDRERKMLYYFDASLGTNGEWVALNPIGIVHGDNGMSDIRPQDASVNNLNMSLGLPVSEVAKAKLDVNGNVKVRGNIKVDGSDTIQQNLIVKGVGTVQSLQVDGSTTLQSPVTINNTLTVNGNIGASGQTISASTINAADGTATVPIGGIIMWSGTLNSWPSNWKLCDGQIINDLQSPMHNQYTPNLQGRFIVGVGQSYASDGRETSTPYYSIGSRGGRNMYALSEPEMPRHNHTIWLDKHDNRFSNGGGSGKIDEGNAEPTGYTGGNQPHENRPPYYALAYIIRIR